jgi:hypothetical protein
VRTGNGQPIDHLIVHNLTHYAEWIQQRCKVVGNGSMKTTSGIRTEPAKRVPLLVCNNEGG